MSQKVIEKIVGQVFAIAIETAFILWSEILLWISSSLLLWIQKDMIPLLEETVKLAFMTAAVITDEILCAVKDAWRKVKKILLEMIVEYENSVSSGAWKKRVTSLIVKKIEANRPVVTKIEIEEDVDWDSLPQEVRKTWLRNNQTNYRIDFMDAREMEMQEMIITN